MARKLRLQFAGALYHVINRGNYRADVFASDGAKEAGLGEAVEVAEDGRRTADGRMSG